MKLYRKLTATIPTLTVTDISRLEKNHNINDDEFQTKVINFFEKITSQGLNSHDLW